MSTTMLFPSLYPVTCHTDHVGQGSTFVAIKGMKDDGVAYIAKAIARGAAQIVVQQDSVMPDELVKLMRDKHIKVHYVPNTRKALAQLSEKALNYPARSLRIIAVTGTKGKSTTSFIIEHILKTAGYKTALISTVKNRIGDTEFPATLTTPQPDYIHLFFSLCRQAQVEYVVMEVAAQALSLHRVDGIYFDAALFTNFSLEHSEFYDKLDDYFAAKASLFKQLKPGAPAIINADDPRIWQLSVQLSRVFTFGYSQWSDIKARIEQTNLTGTSGEICSAHNTYKIQAPTLVGLFNSYNIMAAATLAHALGIDTTIVQQALATFKSVPGRLERFVLRNGATAFIDYAHNPSSYEAVLSALRTLSSHLVVVFGAGGERDTIKRPLMGAIAAQFADTIILTSDNPRSEDPLDIIQHIKSGIPAEHQAKVHCEQDREIAIKKAYDLSHSGSIIVLLGKGPEEYQLIKGAKMPFSEANILRSLQKDAIISASNS